MVEFSLETPLAQALSAAIQPKLLEAEWITDSDDTQLAEIIMLMLANNKTQTEVAAELGDVLGLAADEPMVATFAGWLFEQVGQLQAQVNGAPEQGADAGAGGVQDDAMESEFDADTMGGTGINDAPTGPKAMRNGRGGGREKRMIGHISKAMDRNGEGALHRVQGARGGAGINTHSRGPPTGPRGGRFQRNQNNRAAGIENGLMAGMGGPQNPQFFMMPGQDQFQQQPSQMALVQMIEQQGQMMQQLQQQLMTGSNAGGFGGRGRGKPLHDRVQRGGHKNRRGGHHSEARADGSAEAGAEGQDVDMAGEKREPPNPDDSVCKYNLRCTNKECKFAHQSPAAAPGTTVDVQDVCSFGAACKNRKCVGRHPSPAQKFAHQSEQDCKFFPNCSNPNCTFRHPSMPMCRNGADCTTTDCKFTHVKTKCRFKPCLNRNCAFAHDDGQQGGFKDKVWTAEGGEHVSERKFVDDAVQEELLRPEEQHDVEVTL